MTGTLRPIRHEDRLSLVEHLDELRTRLIICVTAFVICFGVCLWQDDVLSSVMLGEVSAAEMLRLASLAYSGLAA